MCPCADAVIRMLHFNEPAKRDVEAVEAFKVLVIDNFTLKVVATLLHTEALRYHGVTLVLAIDKEREAIKDAPVVYFVENTLENANSIVKDLETGLYKEVSNLCHTNMSDTSSCTKCGYHVMECTNSLMSTSCLGDTLLECRVLCLWLCCLSFVCSRGSN
jgi:hypothetical protein